MPGYIMHMAEANLILERIGTGKSDDWKRAFIAGSLLPDTKKKEKKVTSHFWDPLTLEHMAIAPDLDRFLSKYGHILENPVVLGYYAHLYLDERFVHVYWKDMVEFYDDSGSRRYKKKEITQALVKKSGRMISRDLFFSGEYYYGDYSKLNDYFIRKYSIDMGTDYADIPDCPVEEVDRKDLYQVLKELRWIMDHFQEGREAEIRVFSRERLCKFLEQTAVEFAGLVKGGRL